MVALGVAATTPSSVVSHHRRGCGAGVGTGVGTGALVGRFDGVNVVLLGDGVGFVEDNVSRSALGGDTEGVCVGLREGLGVVGAVVCVGAWVGLVVGRNSPRQVLGQ